MLVTIEFLTWLLLRQAVKLVTCSACLMTINFHLCTTESGTPLYMEAYGKQQLASHQFCNCLRRRQAGNHMVSNIACGDVLTTFFSLPESPQKTATVILTS